MARPTAVILVVGLSRSLIGRWSPRIGAFANGGRVHRLRPILPAVTCSVQASMLTGALPCEHGVVGNGWYHRELAEVHFWKQSNRLVGGEKVWEAARRRDPTVTCANLFWWFNMYSRVDYSVTPRPIYRADGRKLPDIYCEPAGLRDLLQDRLGVFPLFQFWGPKASIRSSRWIAGAAKIVHSKHRPTLTLVYLPHLDYDLQRLGPEHAEIAGAVAEVDAVVGDLIDYFRGCGVRVMLASEYGIEAVDDAVFINRVLRAAGLLRVRDERGLEQLDAGASEAFAVADHQVAHVYVSEPGRAAAVASLCRGVSGVEAVLGRAEQGRYGLDHPRAGDLVLIAERNRWFTYDYWLDDRRAPDYARTVDIHRKPGYDPRELFMDPTMKLPRVQLAWKLLRRKLGQRTLLDVVPLDTRLVRGSHGRVDQDPGYAPLLITESPDADLPEELPCERVKDVILGHLFAG